MKHRMVLALTAALLSAGALNPARADPFTFTFDENGNGIIDLRDGTGPHTLNGTLLADPSGGSASPVLTFLLPGFFTTGDVRVFEDVLGGTLSDVLRFTDANGDLAGAFVGDRLIVYSDLPEAGETPSLADTGLPANLTPRDGGGVVEVGREGNNVATYAPNGAVGHVYIFHSDGAVPEPSSVSLLGLGVLGAAGLGYARRRRPHRAAADLG